MATIPKETNETGIDAVRDWWIAALDRLESIVPWLAVSAKLLAYVGLHVVFIGGALIATVYLTTALSGMTGIVAFFMVGLPLIVGGRQAAHRLFVGGLA